MIGKSQEGTGREDGDITQLLVHIAHHPQTPERTLDVFTTFVSDKDFVGVARRMKKEDLGKLVDVIDQVRSPDS